jgi:hypothetical protein
MDVAGLEFAFVTIVLLVLWYAVRFLHRRTRYGGVFPILFVFWLFARDVLRLGVTVQQFVVGAVIAAALIVFGARLVKK